MTEVISTIRYQKNIASHNRDTFSGYIITTKSNDLKEQVIKFGITTEQLCCEYFGCELYHGDVLIHSINTDCDDDIFAKDQTIIYDEDNLHITGKPKWTLDEANHYKGDQDMRKASIIIPINVSNIKMVMFNAHNGYYPHHIYVSWDNYEDSQEL